MEGKFICDCLAGGGNGDEDSVAGDFDAPVEVVDAASGNAGAMPDEGPPKTVKTKESLRHTLPKKAVDYQVCIFEYHLFHAAERLKNIRFLCFR